MVRALVAAAVCLACQGQPTGGAGVGPGSGSAAGDASAARDARGSAGSAAGDMPGSAGSAGDLRGSAGDAEPHARPEEPDVPDPGRVIAELGAIPAWQAVVDRAQLLARRGQHGVVYGRVGPPVMVPAPHAARRRRVRAPQARAGSGGSGFGGRGFCGGRQRESAAATSAGSSAGRAGDGGVAVCLVDR